jgi:hypothetical protein
MRDSTISEPIEFWKNMQTLETKRTCETVADAYPFCALMMEACCFA